MGKITQEWKQRYREAAIALARQEYADQECNRLRSEAMDQLRKCEEYVGNFRYAADHYREQLAELEGEVGNET